MIKLKVFKRKDVRLNTFNIVCKRNDVENVSVSRKFLWEILQTLDPKIRFVEFCKMANCWLGENRSITTVVANQLSVRHGIY